MNEIYTQFWNSTWWGDKLIATAIFFLLIGLIVTVERRLDK